MWRSFHDELNRTVPSDPTVAIANTDDADRTANYLQKVITSAMDKHMYEVPETNRRSQLPEEVPLAIQKRCELCRRWQQIAIKQLNAGLVPSS